jgi:hypothetical protein
MLDSFASVMIVSPHCKNFAMVILSSPRLPMGDALDHRQIEVFNRHDQESLDPRGVNAFQNSVALSSGKAMPKGFGFEFRSIAMI